MTNLTLARSYLLKAWKRLKILPVLMEEEAYSDVVREAQEIVELALKGMLRHVGIEPPKWHDVGPLVVEQRDRWPRGVQELCDELAETSRWLRKEREFSFYGEIDFIPSEQYVAADAERAMTEARQAVTAARMVIDPKGELIKERS
ncbi:MAG TPA: HEPN domain-containing protein [Acidobacteriota bacterium]|nr:HEPN domain-containing protein [Acidobacteriota bacterium]HRV07129.1 HEPN domain-containing protein [Acidobacteriota bacterium]